MLYKKADGSVDEEVWEKEEEDDEEVVFVQNLSRSNYKKENVFC